MLPELSANRDFSEFLVRLRDRRGHATWNDFAAVARIGVASVNRILAHGPDGLKTRMETRRQFSGALGYQDWWALVEAYDKWIRGEDYKPKVLVDLRLPPPLAQRIRKEADRLKLSVPDFFDAMITAAELYPEKFAEAARRRTKGAGGEAAQREFAPSLPSPGLPPVALAMRETQHARRGKDGRSQPRKGRSK